VRHSNLMASWRRWLGGHGSLLVDRCLHSGVPADRARPSSFLLHAARGYLGQGVLTYPKYPKQVPYLGIQVTLLRYPTPYLGTPSTRSTPDAAATSNEVPQSGPHIHLIASCPLTPRQVALEPPVAVMACPMPG
jgi:hypothetical protein